MRGWPRARSLWRRCSTRGTRWRCLPPRRCSKEGDHAGRRGCLRPSCSRRTSCRGRRGGRDARIPQLAARGARVGTRPGARAARVRGGKESQFVQPIGREKRGTESSDGGWVVRFTHGEEIGGCVRPRARIKGGGSTCSARSRSPKLGYYHLDTRSTRAGRSPATGRSRRSSATSAGSTRRPVLHVHTTIGGPDFSTQGGHLFAGRAGATCEVFVRDLGVDLGARKTRPSDSRCGRSGSIKRATKRKRGRIARPGPASSCNANR